MKRFLTCFALCAYSAYSFGTHYRAADIAHKLLDASTLHFEITITTYSKASSVQADRNYVEINWGDGTIDTISRVNGPVDLNGNHLGEWCNTDVKKNIYKSTHHYPGTPPPPQNFYILSFYDPNRVDAINNIDNGNSVNVPMYVEDTLFIYNLVSAGVNSSPEFLYCGTDYTNLNDTFTYNPVAHDADGDSLVFELAIPLQAPEVTVPIYAYPEQFCQATGSNNNSFQMDSLTGAISWHTPCRIGIYNIAFRVREYRCGVLLSTVMRDMQIIVLNENNNPPQVSFISDTIIEADEAIQITVTASDPDVSHSVSFQIFSGAFLAAQDTPLVQSVPGNPATATITWQTGSATAKKYPYIFSAVATDNYTPINFSAHQTFTVRVSDTSTCAIINSVEEVAEKEDISVYPNPSHHNWQLTVGNNLIGSIAEVFDAEGRVVFQQLISNHQSLITLDVSRGVYLLRITSARHTVTRKLIKL